MCSPPLNRVTRTKSNKLRKDELFFRTFCVFITGIKCLVLTSSRSLVFGTL